MFVFVGTHLDRQFEFVKTQWLNDGVFIGAPVDRSPPPDGRRCVFECGGAIRHPSRPRITEDARLLPLPRVRQRGHRVGDGGAESARVPP